MPMRLPSMEKIAFTSRSARFLGAMLLATAFTGNLWAEGEPKLSSNSPALDVASPASTNPDMHSSFDAGLKLPKRPPTADFDLQRWAQRDRTDFYIHSMSPLGARGPQSGLAMNSNFDDNVVELRWKMSAAHRAIPTFEVAGCDLISARDFYPAPHLQHSPPSSRPRLLQKARQAFSSKVAGMMRSGCD